MAKKFPADEFDSVDGVGGLHRAKVTPGHRLLASLKYIAATGIITTAGIFGLNVFTQSATYTGTVNDPSTTTVQPVVEKYEGDGVGIAVVDATGKNGRAMKVAQQILDAGWNVYGASNAVFGEANKTVVYLNNESVKDAATTLLKTIGEYPIKVSGVYPDPITVIVGKDYK